MNASSTDVIVAHPLALHFLLPPITTLHCLVEPETCRWTHRGGQRDDVHVQVSVSGRPRHHQPAGGVRLTRPRREVQVAHGAGNWRGERVQQSSTSQVQNEAADRLTCASLDVLRPLERPAERRHHDLIKPPGGQRGQPVTPLLAAQRDRRENASVVEEQSDLETRRRQPSTQTVCQFEGQ